MNVIEGLQYVSMSKFSHGWPKLQEICKIIRAQYSIKGFLRNRNVLIRLTFLKDFVNLTSKSVYYLNLTDGNSYQMRPLIYDSKFKVGEETPMSMAWISFPNLLPTYFVKESMFSLALAVGKPL